MHYNNALYSPEGAVEAVSMNNLTTCSPTHYIIRPFEPRMSLYGFPFLHTGYGQVKAQLQSALEKDMWASLAKKGIKVLWCKTNGYDAAQFDRDFPGAYALYNKFPVVTSADFAGKRIRVMTEPAQVKLGDALGFNGQATTFQEAGVALQTGMLDGLITCPDKAYYIPLGVFENAKYCIWWPPTQIGTSYQIVPVEWWDTLPKDLQDALLATIPDILSNALNNVDLPVRYEAAGMVKKSMAGHIEVISKDEFLKWQALCDKVIWGPMAQDIPGGPEAVAAIKAMPGALPVDLYWDTDWSKFATMGVKVD